MTDPGLNDDDWMLDAPWDSVADDLPVEQISDDPEPLQLRGEGDANRMLRRIGAADREVARIEALAAAEIDRVRSWAEAEVGKVTRYRSWFDRSLEAWMRAQHAADGRVKTVSLPAGQVKIRPVQPKLIAPDSVDDPDVWTERLHQFGIEGAVETIVVHKVRKQPIKTVVSPGPALSNGNLPEGITLSEGETVHAAVTDSGELVPDVFLVVGPKRVTTSPSNPAFPA